MPFVANVRGMNRCHRASAMTSFALALAIGCGGADDAVRTDAAAAGSGVAGAQGGSGGAAARADAGVAGASAGTSGVAGAGAGGVAGAAGGGQPVGGTGGAAGSSRDADVVLESRFGSAQLSIEGTVTFPREVPAGTVGQLMITKGTRPSSVTTFNEGKGFVLSKATRAIRYAVTGLDATKYVVFVGLDVTRDNKIGSGDLGGFYDGSVDAPIVAPDLAKLLDLSGGAAAGADFGLGTLP